VAHVTKFLARLENALSLCAFRCGDVARKKRMIPLESARARPPAWATSPLSKANSAQVCQIFCR